MKVSNSFFNSFAIAALVLLLPVWAAGQQYAFVINSQGEAVEDAVIVYYPVGKPTQQKLSITNTGGRALIEAETSVEVIISKIGFGTLKDTLNQGQTKKFVLKANDICLKDVVVTGQFEAQAAQDAVQKVRVIDRQRIEQQGAVSLRDVLTNEINIRVSQDGVLGSQMSMMGLGGQNVKILIDGVPVIGRMDGNIDISQINLNNIERIEIIEGPMSVIYGTDALGGVINLISKRPKSKQYSVGLNSYFETVGTYNTDVTLGFKHKQLAVSASLGRNFFDGFSTVTGDSIRAMQWKPKEQLFGDIQLTYKFKKQSHRLSAQGFNETITSKNNPVFTPYSITAFDDYFVTNRWNTSLYSDFYFNNKATLNLIQSYSSFERRKNSYIKNLVSGDDFLTSNPEDHDTTTFELWLTRGTYTTHNSSIFNSQLGYDINLENGTGKRLEGNKQFIGDYAAFYIAELKLFNHLTINQGLRAIYNTRYDAPLIPSTNIKLNIGERWVVRGSYARGFRAPSLKELSLFFVDVNHNIKGNEDLKAERSNNFLLSLSYLKEWYRAGVKVDVSAFHNAVNNMISLAIINPNSQLYSYTNIDEYRTKGINVSSIITYKQLTSTVGYSYIGRYNQMSANQDIPSFSYTPEYKLNLRYSVLKTRTDMNLFYKYNGALPGYALDEHNQVYQTQVSAYSMLDASITQKFFRNNLQISVGVKNILDVNTINYNTTASAHSAGSGNMSVAMGRYLFTSIRINLAKN